MSKYMYIGKGYNCAKGAVIARMESVVHDVRQRGREERRKYPFSEYKPCDSFSSAVSSSIHGTQKPIVQNASAPQPLRCAAAFTAVFSRTS